MATPFDDAVLKGWFFESFPTPPINEDGIATMGSRPFEEADLDDFLYERGLGIYISGTDTEILIVGREGWSEDALEDLLEMRAGKALKVYSQEMFLAFWASGRDPFDDAEVARRFGEGHPALDYLSELGFNWPTTYVGVGDGEFNAEMPTIGLLRYLGYKVGKSGLQDRERREILRVVYVSQLPRVFPPSYLQEWGGPESRERLHKMANSLAAFCRNEKRKANPSEMAIEDWENDLDWLRRNYYVGRFRFQWPSVYVRA